MELSYLPSRTYRIFLDVWSHRGDVFLFSPQTQVQRSGEDEFAIDPGRTGYRWLNRQNLGTVIPEPIISVNTGTRGTPRVGLQKCHPSRLCAIAATLVSSIDGVDIFLDSRSSLEIVGSQKPERLRVVRLEKRAAGNVVIADR